MLPSRNENSPNALAEAMIVGLPVLASDVGGIPDMIDDGVTGFLFPSEDEAALAEKLLLLIRNDELSVLMGARARQAARPRHRPEHVAELTVNAYREILNSRDMRSNG